MTDPRKRVCLNMIVKNEAAIIFSCLSAVIPFIDCYAIVDTGSSDGTPDLIKKYMAESGIPGIIEHHPFINFSQARNCALDAARRMTTDEGGPHVDYLLLVDADMELVVGGDFRACLTAPAYEVLQRQGTLAYYNTRLVHIDSGARYHGVTHEYVAVEGGQRMPENLLSFLDHATGSNRPDKVARDTQLLTKAVDDNPDDVRSWFYLAQTYKDAGRFLLAIDAFNKRIALGGWAEEQWYARLQLAECYRQLQNNQSFVATMIDAYNARPSRGEPLYALSKFYREKGENAAGLLFAAKGLTLPYPQDSLFVDEYAHRFGFQEEVSILAYYDSNFVRREQGFSTCNDLALSPTAPEHTREQARSNLFHYLPKLTDISTCETKQLENPSPGWKALNPSVTRYNGETVCNVRTVNYSITPSGHYDMNGDTAIRTVNYLVTLDDDFNSISKSQLDWSRPSPAFAPVIGLEDVRLFPWNGGLWLNACIREQNPEGWCEQVLARVEGSRVVQWAVMRPPHRHHEKNWMALVDGADLWFVYRPGLLFDPARRRMAARGTPSRAVEHFSGGTQCLSFDGGWLAVMHEARPHPSTGQRFYQHRFVWFDHNAEFKLVSKPFVFNDRQIEFAAGIARHPRTGKILISYGVRDCEAWIAVVDALDIRSNLQ